MCKELVARLARACARGWRQEQLVTELLTGRVLVGWTPVGPNSYTHFGNAKVTSKSYYNLRNRLIHVGFVFERNTGVIIMSFPENKES